MRLKVCIDGKGSIAVSLDEDLAPDQIEALAARSIELISNLKTRPIGFSGAGGFETELADEP